MNPVADLFGNTPITKPQLMKIATLLEYRELTPTEALELGLEFQKANYKEELSEKALSLLEKVL
jgi:hypothetical protein